MNIYKLTRISDWEYDEYDGFVVYAKTESDALAVVDEFIDDNRCVGEWVDHSDVDITALGISVGDVDRGVVLGSFRAG